MGNAAAIRRGGASKSAAGAAAPEAAAAPDTPRRSPEAGPCGHWTRAEAAEKLQDAELSFRTQAAEQACLCSRLWAGLRDELVAKGVLRDSRSPVPLGPGAERACMQVRVALAARDTEQLQEALANWESFGFGPMVEGARAMLAELRREEEVETLLRCMTSCLTAMDRVGFCFWHSQAQAAHDFALPDLADVAMQALRLKERAIIAERVKQSRHAASPRTEPDAFPEPLAQLDVGVLKAELARRKVSCNSVIEKEELVQMLRAARESKGGSGGDGARAGQARGVRGSPRNAAGVVPGFLGGVREGLPPQSFKAYASERDQAVPSWPSDARPAEAPAVPEGAAGPPLVRPRSAAARCNSVGPAEAPPARPQSAKQRYAAAAAEAAWAGLRRGRVSSEPPTPPAPSPRQRSAAPRVETEAATPRPSTHSAGGRSASKESWVVNGSVSYRSGSAAPAPGQRGPGTPRATPRGLAANAAGVLDPRAAARGGSSPQTPRTPHGGAAAPEPSTPRGGAGPAGFQASPQAARPKRTPLLPQNQSPPPKPSPSPSSFWQQSPPRPSQHSAAGESPRPSPTKPPQMPRRPSAYDKAGVTRQQALACLGLQGNPSADDLRKAYKEAAMRWHPDRQQNHANPEEAKERFQEVQAAFELLKPAVCQAAVAGG